MVYSSAFKKEYSVMSNAINYLYLEEGITECYFFERNYAYGSQGAQCIEFKNALRKKLNMQPIENDFNYAASSDVLKNGGTTVHGGVAYQEFKNFNSYVLPDGAVWHWRDYQNPSNSFFNVSFIVDTNGKKGPNKWGYDVFWLVLHKNENSLRLTDENATLSEKDGSLPRNILQNKWSNYYKPKGYGNW